ncbi:RNA recognition motif domain [Macleaya cordata]|uniref:RNA recognition motif domain n=1 Tax=Macleaya cordata TaxID=56857 RepID=A0A200Q7N0_MACCD|nr:RNA recognition motif domain [Macleaya cordata]
MNPLTLVKRIQKINSREAALGISEGASWHAKYKESAYVFVGGIPFDLTEGDLLAVFAQYGEIVDVNLVRDKGTGKSKGFCFIAYEDQRSTNLAVDNLNGANVLGRIIRVDHVSNYKKKEEEDEEEEQRKREERGVCRAFQRGDCTRGAACKFSHNEQRSANTGWGAKDDGGSRWEQDKYEGPSKRHKNSGNISSDRLTKPKGGDSRLRSDDKLSRAEDNEGLRIVDKRIEMNSRDQDRRGIEKRSERYEKETNPKDSDRRTTENRPVRHESEPNRKEDRDKRGRQERSGRYDSEPNPTDRDNRGKEEKSGRHESEPNPRGDCDNRGKEERSGRQESEQPNPRGDRDNRGKEERLGRHESKPNPRGERDNRGKEERLARHESDPNKKEDRHHREGEKRSRCDRDSSYHHRRDENDANCRSHR